MGKVGTHDSNKNMPDLNKTTHLGASEALTNKIHNELGNASSGIGCLESTFSLQVKDGS